MDDVRRMLDLLDDPDPQIRRYGLAQLDVSGLSLEDEELLERLRVATGDVDPAVAVEANRVLIGLLHQGFGLGASAPGLRVRRRVPSGTFEGTGLDTLRTAGLARLEDVLERLHALACGSDLSLAKRAVMSLAKIGFPGSLAALTETLGRPGLGELSAVALAQLTTQAALEPLMAAIDGADMAVRAHAVLGLGAFDVPGAVERLCGLVKEKNPVIRANAAIALGDVRDDDEALGALGRLARDPEVWVAVPALQALAAHPDRRAHDLVGAALVEASDNRVRATALAALGRRGDVRAVDVVAEYLSAPDERVRANAVEALGRLDLPGDRCKVLLARLAADESNRVVANVAVALHPHEPAKTEQVVQSLLTASSSWAVASGIWCLGEIRTPGTLQMLVRLLGEASEEHRRRVFRALERWSGCPPTDALLGLLDHPDTTTRARVARALGCFTGGGLAARLAARFTVETEPTVRSALVFALGAHSSTTLEPLVRALQDPSARVVADAVEVLGATSDMQVVTRLRPLIRHQHNRVQANACVGLWRSGELDVADDVSAMLSPTSPASQRSAMYAAGEMGRVLRHLDSPSVDPALPSALQRFHEQVSRGFSLPETPSAVPRDTTAGAAELEAVLDRYVRDGAEAALARLPSVPASHPLPTEAAFLAYRLRAEAGKSAEAFRLLEQICEMAGVFVTPVLELAHGYSRLRFEDKAVVCFLEAYRRHQTILTEILEAAARSVQASKLSDATQLCKFLMANPAIGPDIHLVAGRELLGAGDAASAFPHLLRAHLGTPREPSVTLEYAWSACRLGRVELGRRLCEQVFLLCSDETPAHVALVAKARKMVEAIAARTTS